MKKQAYSSDFELIPANTRHLAALCGQFDENLKFLESSLGVSINNRGNTFHINGPTKTSVSKATELLQSLYHRAVHHEDIAMDWHHLAQRQAAHDPIEPAHLDEHGIKTPRLTIKARSNNQQQYIDHIFKQDITFGIGPAGTGKTYLAVACAVAFLNAQQVQRIILTRPAVEAGERLGFLPGDLTQKIDPYLRPLYDALYEMLGFERVAKLLERQVIEIAPLAYMRGRTLNDAFIILDEAQNTTMEQMKMFLTRIGFNSRAVVNGDVTQVDLPRGQYSGLRQAIKVLQGIDEIPIHYFDAKDIVRHPLVKRIVEAYEQDEHQEARPHTYRESPKEPRPEKKINKS